MADEFLVIGFLDDLEEGIRYAKINGYSGEFGVRLQAFHDELVDVSNRIEEEDAINRMNEMLEDLVEECFISCREGNQERSEKALARLEDCLKKL